MAKIAHTPQARDSLKEIGRYIAKQSGDREVARNFLRRIDARCQLYAESPLLGDLREELGENVRRFHVGRYEVLYGTATGGIVILLVVHSARDIEAVFRDAFRAGP